MRLSATGLGNALAWAVFAGLAVLALAVADRLGFAGLIVLGGLTWLVCLRAGMNADTPTWSTAVFRAGMQGPSRPEERAARDAERAATALPLRFYARCGMALATVGVLGAAWQARYG